MMAPSVLLSMQFLDMFIVFIRDYLLRHLP